MIGRNLAAPVPAAACMGTTHIDCAANEKPKAPAYDQVFSNGSGRVRVVLVEYEPGGFSPVQTRRNVAFIYATVLEGAIRRQLNDGPVVIYRAGESFSERSGDRRRVDENASDTEPARLIVALVDDEKGL